ncbi:hypothetical protein H2198_000646 [Neophaeococcomyces mojaviensis]|uniref:Uncharacterized protein n=1 Tax=Neophaeococcomyces mojaviensis TaxID=3383035 RepID=A0ACC3AJE3_9EURO|nr:hypothetical protein H2198_000646 [Knufia sp. JES_112]
MAYSLTAELFSELAIGILIFSLRFFARWKVVGFRNFWYDDLFAGIAVVFWVLEATFLYTCENCTFRRGNYIIITILDVVTDMGIIAIPLPLLLATTLSLRRKLTLGLLFSSGIFVMVCSILRAYYSLKDIETLAVALGWASREILVASAVVCAPSIKPLISSAKKKLSSNHRSESGKNHDTSSRGRPKLTDTDYDVERRVTTITTITSGNQKRPGHYKLFSIGRQTSDGDIERTLHKSESQDHINVVVTELDGSSMYSGTGTEQGIYVTTEYSVAKE